MDKKLIEENHSVEAFTVWLVEAFTFEDDVIDKIVDAFEASTKYNYKQGQKDILKTVKKLVNLYGQPRCDDLHHDKKHRYSAFSDCPVEAEINKLKQKLEEIK
jgi:hypothetical protein